MPLNCGVLVGWGRFDGNVKDRMRAQVACSLRADGGVDASKCGVRMVPAFGRPGRWAAVAVLKRAEVVLAELAAVVGEPGAGSCPTSPRPLSPDMADSNQCLQRGSQRGTSPTTLRGLRRRSGRAAAPTSTVLRRGAVSGVGLGGVPVGVLGGGSVRGTVC